MSILNTMVSDTETPFPAWLGPKLVMFVDKPEDIQIVLSQKSFMEKSAFYQFFERKSMFTAPGKFHWNQKLGTRIEYNTRPFLQRICGSPSVS